MSNYFIEAEKFIAWNRRTKSQCFLSSLYCEPPVHLDDREASIKSLRPEWIFVGTGGNDAKPVLILSLLVDHTIARKKMETALLTAKCIFDLNFAVGNLRQFSQREIPWQFATEPIPPA